MPTPEARVVLVTRRPEAWAEHRAALDRAGLYCELSAERPAGAGAVVLDGWDGLALSAPAIVVVAAASEGLSAARAGAVDWVTEPVSTEELLARVLARFGGSRPGRVALGACEIDLASRHARWANGREARLTAQEAEVLAYLVGRAGRVVPREELLRELWGWRGRGATRAVDNTLARLRSKVEVEPAHPEHLLTVHGEGYTFAQPPAAAAVAVGEDFVGRTAELREIWALLADGRAPVTLLGPPGVGKTRLAQRLDGALVARVGAEGGLIHAVARALGLRSAPATIGADVRTALTTLDGILVLDGAEADLPAVRAELPAWTRLPRRLGLLVTSREALRIPGESVVEVPPLPPGEALQLFVQRATLARRGQALDAAAEQAAIALVARLDGLPLAIELAAARTGVMGPTAILGRLKERLAPLHAALESSLEHLDPAERQAFAACAVFAGGFTLDAAEAVVGAQASDICQRLRDRSLLTATGAGEVRLDFLDSVAVVAAERLARLPIRGELRLRHAAFYVAEAESRVQALPTDASGAAMEWLDRERANVVAAVRQATDAPELVARGVIALEQLLLARGPAALWPELLDLGVLAADRAQRADLATRLRVARAELRRVGGRFAAAESDLTDAARTAALSPGLVGLVEAARGALALTREQPLEAAERFRVAADCFADDARRRGMCLYHLALAEHGRARYREAAAVVSEAITVLDAAGDRNFGGYARALAGLVAIVAGSPDGALAPLGDALAMVQQRGDRRAEGIVRSHLAEALHDLGRPEEALASAREALALHLEVGDQHFEARTLTNQALLALFAGDLDGAREPLDAAIAAAEAVQDRRARGRALLVRAALMATRGALVDARATLATAATLLDTPEFTPWEAAVRGLLGEATTPSGSDRWARTAAQVRTACDKLRQATAAEGR